MLLAGSRGELDGPDVTPMPGGRRAAPYRAGTTRARLALPGSRFSTAPSPPTTTRPRDTPSHPAAEPQCKARRCFHGSLQLSRSSESRRLEISEPFSLPHPPFFPSLITLLPCSLISISLFLYLYFSMSATLFLTMYECMHACMHVSVA